MIRTIDTTASIYHKPLEGGPLHSPAYAGSSALAELFVFAGAIDFSEIGFILCDGDAEYHKV